MPSGHRFPPYLIAAGVLFTITFYHVYNVRTKNSELERNVKIFKEALAVSKEKNKVLVKDALEKIEKKDARIKLLERENLSKHTKLGVTQTKLAKMKSQLELNKGEITKLHQLAADHKAEISTLTKSVSKSHEVLTKLSEKADHVMLDHKKLKKQNTELEEQNGKLQNDIKQQQSERQTLDEQLNTLRKEKEDLRIKVNDLTRKNEVIQESIRHKIKESYASRREMIRRQRMKETEDGQPKLKTLEDSRHSRHRPTKIRHTHSLVKDSDQDQVLKDIVDNSDKDRNNISKIVVDSADDNQNNVSKIMVDNSETENVSKMIADNSGTRKVSRIMVDNSDNTQNNISRFMVDNSENKEKRDVSFVAKIPTTAENNLVGGQESLNDSTSDYQIPAFRKSTEKPLDNFNTQDQGQNEGENFENGNTDDGQSLIEDRDENSESDAGGGNANRESPIEGKEEENVHEMRTGVDLLPVFPKIEDETIDKQDIHESPKVYGDNLQDNFKHDSVSETDT
ncbi:Hypothetical predicted protein [Paramuricea clavata]|uniref:Uncharacterized protein n=1 Tax=Paramuricea clavata TaxID=317549 RepID=A0A7D9DRC7_PARCT|nr:Hypothetical predicted protein [Paramuricea clavata]